MKKYQKNKKKCVFYYFFAFFNKKTAFLGYPYRAVLFFNKTYFFMYIIWGSVHFAVFLIKLINFTKFNLLDLQLDLFLIRTY